LEIRGQGSSLQSLSTSQEIDLERFRSVETRLWYFLKRRWLIEIGKPYLRVWQGTNKIDYPLSISHDNEYVVAVVMNMGIIESSKEYSLL
jgi:hypothetical protein